MLKRDKMKRNWCERSERIHRDEGTTKTCWRKEASWM